MRLIDIDALPDGCAWCGDALIEAINDAPIVDAVPRERYDRLKENAEILSKACAEKEYVVRCKNCKRFDPDTGQVGLGICEIYEGVTAEYGFCHHGKRKDGEQDDS